MGVDSKSNKARAVIRDTSPQQRVFNSLYRLSLDLGYKTYDFLPHDKASYPFVFIGETFEQERQSGRSLHGNIQLTIHIYGDYRQRTLVTTMIDKLKLEAKRTRKLTNEQWINYNVEDKPTKDRNRFNLGGMNFNVIRSNGQTLFDNSTPERLVHGILELEIKYN